MRGGEGGDGRQTPQPLPPPPPRRVAEAAHTLSLLRPPEERRPSVVYEEDFPVNLRRASVTMTLRITSDEVDDGRVNSVGDGGGGLGCGEEEGEDRRQAQYRRGRSASWMGRLSGR